MQRGHQFKSHLFNLILIQRVSRDPEELEDIIKSIRNEISLLELRSETLERLRPHPKPNFPTPRLRLKISDLSHPGTAIFFANSNPVSALSEATKVVLSTLYSPTKTNEHISPTRSITLILRSMPGVAYTTGSDLDESDKKISFSLDYINGVSKRPPQSGPPGPEIQGVLVHEMVHCWQWNALGSAPGGLIEGVADFVRLKAGFCPAHWKREAGEKWDAGYQHTGYFLDWIESELGEGSVKKINQALKNETYQEEKFWNYLFGKSVSTLWNDYLKSFGSKGGEDPTTIKHDRAELFADVENDDRIEDSAKYEQETNYQG